eukprot:GAFH01005913.1.p2 GENE.GAFH01005913.1~~GAFH01005913.1.p2  ORF type:complete len:165 (-),score=37.08 GAFH01005913.1:82-540(-)
MQVQITTTQQPAPMMMQPMAMQPMPVQQDMAVPASMGVPVAVVAVAAPKEPGFYHSSICSCFDDCGICCKGFWCPCLLVADNATLGEACDCCSCCGFALGFGCCVQCSIRGRVKRAYNIPASCCADCCSSMICLTCSICQDAREIQFHKNSH